MLTFAFNIQPVKSDCTETIYIRADGSVDPPDAPISSVDNITYTFTDNIYDSIVVERDNIVVDGAGYTLQGAGACPSKGIDLSYRSNVTIKNMQIKTFYYGLRLFGSSNNRISRNNITNNEYGIYLYDACMADICSLNNSIYHNNFIENTRQILHNPGEYPPFSLSTNIWDDAYPSGGNYWSDYNGTDTDHDGIGDIPYVINVNNTDFYPLMGMFSDSIVDWANRTYHVTTICNSTISQFRFNGTKISFNVAGENGTAGFCRICIPTALINATCRVYVDRLRVHHDLLPCSNSDYSYLYFAYNHITHKLIEHADLNNDGIINVLDMILVTRSWNSKPGNSNWDPKADLNDDCIINILDLILVVRAIGEFPNIARLEVVITPTLLTDFNSDGKVDMSDVDVATAAFGSHPQHFRWNARADMDNNRVINIKDIALVAHDFGTQ